MKLLQKFQDNLRKPATNAMLYAGTALGLFAPSKQADAQVSAQYYLGYGHMSSELLGGELNPYATGGHLYAGGRISLNDNADTFLGKHGFLMGEYSYQFSDPQQYSYEYTGEFGGQVHHVSYSHINSTATIAAGLNFSAGNMDITAAAGPSWYFGSQNNWLNNANFTALAEVRYALFKKQSPVNIEGFGRFQYTKFSNNFRNEIIMPDGLNQTTTAAVGVRLTLGQGR